MTEEPVKRKRGRPRKYPLVAVAQTPIVEEVKRKRGRPRKHPLPEAAPAKVKVIKNYYVLSPDDVEMWAQTTDTDMFKQAWSDYKKMLKSKFSPEIRWQKDGIVVVAK